MVGSQVWSFRGLFHHHDIVVKVKNELVKELHGEKDCRFIFKRELVRFWSPQNLRSFFQALNIKLSEDQLNDIAKELLQILSTLVVMKFLNWKGFHKFYFDNGKDLKSLPKDSNLPIQHPECLPYLDRNIDTDCVQDFKEQQQQFAPIIIYEGYVKEYDSNRRLPFANIQADGETGAGGKVRAVKIPLGGVVAPGRPKQYSAEEGQVFAWKKLHSVQTDDSKIDRTEFENLKKIDRDHKKHLNIVQHVAAVQLGNNFNILFELATTDLDDLLLGKTSPMKEFTENESPFETKTVHLLEQLYWLTDALQFLHDILGQNNGEEGQGTGFCHMDIKPNNILIYRTYMNEPAGTWKLTDFGISKERELQSHDGAKNMTVLTQSEQYASLYQPPEVRHRDNVGRSGDIWSLGCVIMLVLVFAFENSEGVKEMRRLMVKDADGKKEYKNDHFYRATTNTPKYEGQLNPHVSKWLKKLPEGKELSSDHGTELESLVRKMLSIKRVSRPSAIEVLRKLYKIKESPDLRRPQSKTKLPIGSKRKPERSKKENDEDLIRNKRKKPESNQGRNNRGKGKDSTAKTTRSGNSYA